MSEFYILGFTGMSADPMSLINYTICLLRAEFTMGLIDNKYIYLLLAQGDSTPWIRGGNKVSHPADEEKAEENCKMECPSFDT